jgi:hypothetical protein
MMERVRLDLPGGDFGNRGADNFIYEPNTPYYSGNGTYRTLCVRTCDGYYFPISFSTTSDHLPEDARSCEALCPGAEARLFYHPNPGGGPENMISVTGEPYSSLANASNIAPASTLPVRAGLRAVMRRRVMRPAVIRSLQRNRCRP